MKLASLQELGIPSLSPEESIEVRQDPVMRLKMINQSLLLNFLQLINTLVVDSSKAAEKTEHLRILLIHMHHSINEYRPHQVRYFIIQGTRYAQTYNEEPNRTQKSCHRSDLEDVR